MIREERDIKAAALVELNKPLVMADLELPALDVGHELGKVHRAGVCGAQLGEISGIKGADKFLLHALGHAGGGVVQEIGPGVTHVEPGEHVVMHCRNASIGPSTRRWPPA